MKNMLINNSWPLLKDLAGLHLHDEGSDLPDACALSGSAPFTPSLFPSSPFPHLPASPSANSAPKRYVHKFIKLIRLESSE